MVTTSTITALFLTGLLGLAEAAAIPRADSETFNLHNAAASSSHLVRRSLGKTATTAIVVIVVGWVLGWFVMGCFESYSCFSKKMRGEAHRAIGIPYCWAMIPGVLPAILLLIFQEKKYIPQKEDKRVREAFKKAWYKKTAGGRFVCWLKHGIKSESHPPPELVETERAALAGEGSVLQDAAEFAKQDDSSVVSKPNVNKPRVAQ